MFDPKDLRPQDLIHSLPEETPSMAWRSSLNERLRAEAKTVQAKRKTRLWTFSTLGTGFAAASVVALALLSAPLPVSNPSNPISGPVAASEVDLLALHGEASATADVSATGPIAYESDLTEVEIGDAFTSQLL